MRAQMLELMRQLANNLVAEESFAHEFAQKAAQAERLADVGTAAIMRNLARRHQVKALELDGQLASLRERYATLYGYDSPL